MAVLLTPFYLQFFNSDGSAPLSGGFVYTYSATSSIPKATYTDFTETVQAQNPIPLDAGGRATIWISGSYKFVATDALGNIVRTTDNVTAFNTPSASNPSYFQSFSGDGTQTVFPLSQDLGTDENGVLFFINTSGAWAPVNPTTITLTSGGSPTITFSSAPAAGTNNIYGFAPSLLLGAASAAAEAAATSEANAAASATLSEQWATLTSGQVASTDFSSKAYAIGGTGVTTLVGAAKEWATLVTGTVDGTLFSAKEYAQGSQATTGGSSKNWSQETGSDVTGASANDRSSKSWAQEDLHGVTLGGSSKDWAQSASLPDGVNKSSKSYAADSSTSASSSATSSSTASGFSTVAQAAAAQATTSVISVSHQWAFATSTTMGDPSTGNIRFNNATLASVTQIAISALSNDTGNPNLDAFIATWDDSTHNPRGIIRIIKNATNFIILGVNSALTDNSTWLQIPVTVIEAQGSLSAADPLFISFAASGNDGSGTGNVSTSGTPSTGSLTKWASGTTIANADLTGDVTTSGGVATTIAANVVTNAKAAQMAANTVKVNATAGTANATDLSLTTNTLLGRGASNVVALALGTNLSISGSTLNATGGGITKVVQQPFSANGTYIPTSGMVYCIVECVGAGGGGGGAKGAAAVTTGGVGGGAGAYSCSVLTAAAIGASQAVTIGAGGSGGSNAGGPGSIGGDTSLGTLVIAKGGGPGTGGTTTNPGTGVTGGLASGGTGDFKLDGGHSWGGLGSSLTTISPMGGAGGASQFGNGFGYGGQAAPGGNGAGNPGTFGGGGGGAASASTTGNTGGTGGNGEVRIIEFCV